MASSATFKWNEPVLKQVKASFTRGMLRMGYAIANRARSNAPVASSALRNSIRTTIDQNNTVYVIAGGTVGKDEEGKAKVVNGKYKIPYALKREYENNKHPGTKMYMHRAFESVQRGDISQYFRSKL